MSLVVVRPRGLVEIPVDDPRPDPMADKVILTAVCPVAPAILKWAEPRCPVALDERRVQFMTTVAFLKAGADSFRAGNILHTEFALPVDRTLVGLLDAVVERLPGALKIVVGEWVARHGLRFPAHPNDIIEYYDEHDRQVSGRVYGLDPILGLATVIRASDEVGVRVCLEQVVANTSQGLYEPIRRPLGMTYEDAPARIAAANAEDARFGQMPLVERVLAVTLDEPEPPRLA